MLLVHCRKKSLTSCLDQTMPLVANVNEEYRNIANETDASASEEDGILEVMLKSQIGARAISESIRKM